MANQTYLLSFRDTPVWDKYRNDPDGMPGADKVQYFLSQNGIVFIPSQGDSVSVRSDGTVTVRCQNDPALVWPKYDDKDIPDKTQLTNRINQIKDIRDRLQSDPKSVTAAERDLALASVITLALRLLPG